MLYNHCLSGTDTTGLQAICSPLFLQDKTGKKTHSSTSDELENFSSVYTTNWDIPADGTPPAILIKRKPPSAQLSQENHFCIIYYINFQELLYFLRMQLQESCILVFLFYTGKLFIGQMQSSEQDHLQL